MLFYFVSLHHLRHALVLCLAGFAETAGAHWQGGENVTVIVCRGESDSRTRLYETFAFFDFTNSSLDLEMFLGK